MRKRNVSFVAICVLVGAYAYDIQNPEEDHTEYAITMMESGKTEQGLASFRAAVKFAPSASAWANLGMALVDEAHPDHASPDHVSEAAMAFKRALELEPDHQSALENLHGLQGSNDSALSALTDAITNQDFQRAATLCETQVEKVDHDVQLRGGPLLNFLGPFVSRDDSSVPRLARCLIKAGAAVNKYGSAPESVPLLLWAAENRNVELFELMLQHGADHNVQFKLANGELAGAGVLHAVAWAAPAAFVQAQFSQMSEIRAIARAAEKLGGMVAPTLARSARRSMDAILEREREGARIFPQEHMQNLRNIEATYFTWVALERFELSCPLRADMVGRTPLHTLARLGNAYACGIMLQKCPELAAVKDAGNMTALDLAMENDRSAVVEVFRVAGEESEHATLDRASLASDAPPLVGDGGWSSDVEEQHVIDHCDIDELNDIEPDVFYHDYVLRGRPLILRNYAKSWGVRQKWTRSALMRTFGHMQFTTGVIPYSAGYGYQTTTLDLKRYVNAMAENETQSSGGTPHYIFESVAEGTHLTQALRHDSPLRPPFMAWNSEKHKLNHNVRAVAQQFYLGGAGTGAPIHFHSDAWNVCAYGQRRWFLFPPQHASYSKVPMKEWLKDDYPKLSDEQKPLECMQRAGDVIFVPQLFGHGTYNVQDSVGMATEIIHANAALGVLLYRVNPQFEQELGDVVEESAPELPPEAVAEDAALTSLRLEAVSRLREHVLQAEAKVQAIEAAASSALAELEKLHVELGKVEAHLPHDDL